MIHSVHLASSQQHLKSCEILTQVLAKALALSAMTGKRTSLSIAITSASQPS
jgi:hypothetical protein